MKNLWQTAALLAIIALAGFAAMLWRSNVQLEAQLAALKQSRVPGAGAVMKATPQSAVNEPGTPLSLAPPAMPAAPAANMAAGIDPTRVGPGSTATFESAIKAVQEQQRATGQNPFSSPAR